MKKLIYAFFIAGLFATSCSSDDDTATDNNQTNYLPLSEGNYWVYATQNAANTGRDSLYTASDTIIGGNTYTKFRTADVPTGFYSGALNGNAVRAVNGKIIVTGSADFSFSEEVPVALNITDFTFFDANATTGTELSTVNGTISQPAEDGITVNVNYKLTSKAGANVPSITVNNVAYTNVKTVILTLRLSITATLDVFPLPATIMQDQDVVVSTQYYAENIGAIKIDTDINYHLEDLSSFIDLPIDQTGSQHQEETLITYNAE